MHTPEEDETRTIAGGREPARTLGPYRLEQRLGEGGMGEVWLAQQTTPIRRQVAVKILKAGMDSARVIARFEAERQTLAVMDHPAIAKMFDAGTTPEGRPYFVMECVRGESITAYCDRQRLPLRARLELFIQLCEGVQHAHQKGIIHRDLKPSNVLVALVDDRPVPRIIDFGIAKAMAQPLTDGTLFTELGGLLGTPEYMSPEQAAMTADIDTRSDVYSLGLLLYELLVGRLPFDRETFRRGGLDEVRRMIQDTDAPRPSTRARTADDVDAVAAQRQIAAPKLPGALRGDLDWITMKALEKDRARRYATTNALAMDVRRYLEHEPVSAGPPNATYRLRKFATRHRAGVAALSSVAILVVAFAVGMTIQARRIARERDRANQEASTAKQVADFLVGLFNVSDPSEARGNSLTAREILTRGSSQIDTGLSGQPHVQARLQTTMGRVYTELGLYSDARVLLERARQTQRRIVGDEDPDALATEKALADVYFFEGRFRDAEVLYQNIVRVQGRTLGDDHADTLRTAYDLASVYIGQERWDDFEKLAQTTLARQRRALGDTHVDTLNSLNNLQVFYFRRGRFADAAPLAVEVFEARRRRLGGDHPDTLRALHNVATVDDALGRYEKAEGEYLQVLEQKSRVLGAEHPDTSKTYLRLSQMYVKQRRYAEAESAALSAYRGFAGRLGSGHVDTRQTVEQLAIICDATGRPAEAANWRAKIPAK